MKRACFVKKGYAVSAVFLSGMLALMPLSSEMSSIVVAESISGSASDYDLSSANSFVFTDDGITLQSGSADGVKISGTSLAIKESGVYEVSGSCQNGNITIKKNVTGVTLILNGITLGASATAPITCNKGSGVTIVAATDTVNTLYDDEYNNDDIYTDEDQYPDIENAVIKCKDGSNVTICGTGTINITANGKNGIKGGYDWYEEDDDGNATDELLAEASLNIYDVTLNIDANVNDGLKADKVLNIYSGNINISAVDDAIKSDYTLNIGDTDTEGPTINITESNEGIEGATVNIYSGLVTVNATDDGINAANSDLTDYTFSYNQYGSFVYINVTNGDGIDSNGTSNLNGGTLEVYTPSQGDGDPLDSDGGTALNGATVLAVGHLGMPQSYTASVPYVTFGGDTSNAIGGMSGNMPGGMPGNIPGNTGSSLVSAGGKIEITDSEGNVLYEATAVRAASYVLFSSQELRAGSPYTLNCNGSSVSTASASTSSSGSGQGMPGQGSPDQGGPGQGGQGSGNESDLITLPFTDVFPYNWFYQYVQYVYAKGIMTGLDEQTFAPNMNCSRAMVVTVLWRMAGCPEPESTEQVYPDVPTGKWYSKAAAWAKENGIATGYSSGEKAGYFGTDDDILRQDFAKMLKGFADYMETDIPVRNTESYTVKADADEVSEYAAEYVQWAYQRNIIGQGSDFDPKGLMTRAECAAMITRLDRELVIRNAA